MSLENEAAPAAPTVTDAAPVSEAPAAPAPVEEAAPEPSIDDTLREVFRKNNPDRDESGRFRSREPAPEVPETEAEVSTDQPPTEEQPEQAIKPAIQPPQSWSADAKAKWATLPPDVQEVISKRESEAHQAITRQGAELKAVEPIRQVVEQYRDVFERNGVTPNDGLGRLLEAERMLSQDPVTAIATIAQAYGVDLGQFAQGQQSGNVPPEVGALHQKIAWLERQLNETSHRIAEREQAEASTQMQSMQSLIEKFSADKSDWAELETDVLAELVGINAAIQNGIIQSMSADAKLQKAYDRALRNNPEAWNRKQEAERKATEAKRVEEARKRAEDAKRAKAVNVSTNPAKGQIIRSMDDTLRDAYRKATQAS